MTTPKIETSAVRVRAAETGKWPTLGDLRALVAACEGMSDRANITTTKVCPSAAYVGHLAIEGGLIVRDITKDET